MTLILYKIYPHTKMNHVMHVYGKWRILYEHYIYFSVLDQLPYYRRVPKTAFSITCPLNEIQPQKLCRTKWRRWPILAPEYLAAEVRLNRGNEATRHRTLCLRGLSFNDHKQTVPARRRSTLNPGRIRRCEVRHPHSAVVEN